VYPKLSDQAYGHFQLIPSCTILQPSGNESLHGSILSDPLQLVDCIVTSPLANSDHLALKQASAAKQLRTQPRTVWNYAPADFQKACDMIDETN